MNHKKKNERFYLNNFFEKMGLLAHIDRDGNDSDEPDFFVNLDGNKVGFELTQLFKSISGNGSADKKCEMYHHKFLSRLADAYYEISYLPIEVQLLGTIVSNQSEDLNNLARRMFETAKQLDEGKIRILKSISVKQFISFGFQVHSQVIDDGHG